MGSGCSSAGAKYTQGASEKSPASGPPPDQREEVATAVDAESLRYERRIADLQAELEGARAELEALRQPGGPRRRVVNLLHFNDCYNLEPKKPNRFPCGGATRFLDSVKKARAKYSDCLTLFSGDFVGPSLTSAFTKGRHIVEALDTIGVDYGCLGNHEWDYGWDNLDKHINGYTREDGQVVAGSRVEWIMSNLNGEDGQPVHGVAKFATVERSGVKIGLLGLVEDWAGNLPIPKGKAVYVDVHSEGERLARMLKEEQGCDIVVAMTHARLASDYEITAKCPSIDLLLGGHDHFFKMDLANRIVKSGCEFRYLSHVCIELIDGRPPKLSTHIHSVDPTDAEDQEMSRLAGKYQLYIEEKYGDVLCGTDVDVDSQEAVARFGPSLLGMHMADWVRGELDIVADDDDPVDMVFVSGYEAGKGEHVVPAGSDLKVKDLMTFVPNEIAYAVVRLTGAQVREWFEVSVKSLSADGTSECGTLIHPSAGVEATIDVTKAPGARIKEIRFKGEPLEDRRLYTCGGTKWLCKRFPEAPCMIDFEWAVQLHHSVHRGLEAVAARGDRLQSPEGYETRTRILRTT